MASALARAFGSRSRFPNTPSGLKGLSKSGGFFSWGEKRRFPLLPFARSFDPGREWELAPESFMEKVRRHLNHLIRDDGMPVTLVRKKNPAPAVKKPFSFRGSSLFDLALKSLLDSLSRLMEMVKVKILEMIAGGTFWYWYRQAKEKMTPEPETLIILPGAEEASPPAPVTVPEASPPKA